MPIGRDQLAAATRELPTAVLSPASPFLQTERMAKPAFNAAVLLDKGQLLIEQHKRLLPYLRRL